MAQGTTPIHITGRLVADLDLNYTPDRKIVV